MKKINMKDLNDWIYTSKPEVERTMLRNQTSEKLIRTRERDIDEQKIIDKLCIVRWRRAEQDGKIKYHTKRKWFYDFD